MMSITVTAHSGAEGTRNNTVDSVVTACELGADIAEVDINCLTDGTPVLSHNSVGDGTGATRLKELFSAVYERDIKLNLDIKDTAGFEGIKALADEYGMTDRILLTGLTSDFDKAASVLPGVEYYYNLHMKDVFADTLLIARAALDAGCVGINADYKVIRPESVKVFHDAGLSVSVWTVDYVHDMKRLLDMGVDNITTHRIRKLRSIIEKRDNRDE